MEGDYVAHIHQYVKYKIKTIELETGQRYQYPRRHSFQALVGNLIALGLVEKTGRQEDPARAGRGRRRYPPAFQPPHLDPPDLGVVPPPRVGGPQGLRRPATPWHPS